jgi:hypothetical protein
LAEENGDEMNKAFMAWAMAIEYALDTGRKKDIQRLRASAHNIGSGMGLTKAEVDSARCFFDWDAINSRFSIAVES